MMQIIVVAGVCIVLLGLVFMVATLPASTIMEEMQDSYGFSSRGSSSLFAQKIFIYALPIILGFGVMAWGFLKNVEERETGYANL